LEACIEIAAKCTKILVHQNACERSRFLSYNLAWSSLD
jgi:hypothetical protein